MSPPSEAEGRAAGGEVGVVSEEVSVMSEEVRRGGEEGR